METLLRNECGYKGYLTYWDWTLGEQVTLNYLFCLPTVVRSLRFDLTTYLLLLRLSRHQELSYFQF